MRRYRGEGLRPGATVVVIVNDALGNFVAATPLLQMLREQGRQIVLYSGKRIWEFIPENPLVDTSYPIWGPAPREVVRLLADVGDLVINLENTGYAKTVAAVACRAEGFICGPCVGEEGRGELPFADDARGALWADPEWTAADLPERYPFLESGFIGEIFCRLAYLEGSIPAYHVPWRPAPIEIPDLLIATSASLPEKLWPVEKWREVLNRVRAEGLTVGLLGAKPSDQSRYWIGFKTEERLVGEGLATDLRGRLSLPEVVGALTTARAVLTIDNGILHLACAAQAPTVGLFRYGIHRLWAPPMAGLRVLTPEPGEPVSSIESGTVADAVLSVL